jgi:DNA-binding PadR family transcriptional regulator
MTIEKDLPETIATAQHERAAADLLHELRRQGFIVVSDERSLWVLPRNKLTPHQVERIREHRDALIRLVQHDSPEALRDAEAKIRRLESELDTARRINELKEQQVAMLQVALSLIDKPAIPEDMFRTLAGLVHPDRHDGSPAATRAMAWLNSQRRMDS